MEKKQQKTLIGLAIAGLGLYFLLKKTSATAQPVATSLVPSGSPLTGETSPVSSAPSVQPSAPSSTPTVMDAVNSIITPPSPISIIQAPPAISPEIYTPSGYTFATPEGGGAQYLQTVQPSVPSIPTVLPTAPPSWATSYVAPSAPVEQIQEYVLPTPSTPETISAQTPDWFVRDTTPAYQEPIQPAPAPTVPEAPTTISSAVPDWFVQDTTPVTAMPTNDTSPDQIINMKESQIWLPDLTASSAPQNINDQLPTWFSQDTGTYSNDQYIIPDTSSVYQQGIFDINSADISSGGSGRGIDMSALPTDIYDITKGEGSADTEGLAGTKKRKRKIPNHI